MSAEVTQVSQAQPVQTDSNICMFCGIQGLNLLGLYSEEGLQKDILKKIQLYLPIKLSQSEVFSLELCRTCESSILTWHQFVQKAVETTRKLRSIKQEFETSCRNPETNEKGEHLFPPSTSLYAICSNPDGIAPDNKIKLNSEDDENTNEVIENYADTSDYVEIECKISDETNNCTKHELNLEDTNYECHFCPKVLSSEEELLNHTSDTHPDVSDMEESSSTKSNKPKRICSRLDQKIIDAAKVTVENRVYYNCKECGKSLVSPYTYIWHMRIHTGERPFVCDLCGKQFRVSQGLVRHLKETHERIKNFSCDLCGRMFATKRNVDEHRRIHTNERPYVCALCGKAFKQKASLFVHNRTHSDSFPFKCEHCNQGFRSKAPLLIHVTKHTGQKPYPCDICGRCFRIKYELNRHRVVHSEEKPFCCSFCGMRFKQKRYLVNHFKGNHLRN